jgi:hypothetical protein
MRINTKYAGTCPLCRAPFQEGDEIEYQKNTVPICTVCADAGKRPVPKEETLAGGGGSRPAASTSAPSSAGAINAANMALAEAKKTNAILEQILEALRPQPPAPF